MTDHVRPRVRVKICCIASLDEAQIAATSGADLVGLVGPMPSGPGVIDLDRARQIAASAPPWAQPVLLTASETSDAIASEAAHASVTTVQVVRHIDPDEAARLAATSLHYLQVIHVEDHSAPDLIETYAPHCNAFLLDSGRPSQNTFGGTGQAHDWTISAELCQRSPRPVFLAGGLTPDNVAQAIATVRPFGVDICSGVRREGQLDADLLNAFMHSVARQNEDP